MKRKLLAKLAQRCGVLPSYRRAGSRELERTDEATAAALVQAFGYDASTEAAAEASLRRWQAEDRERRIAPTRVVDPHEADSRTLAVAVRDRGAGEVAWEVMLHIENGDRLQRSGRTRIDGTHFEVPLPRYPHGYHQLELQFRYGSQDYRAEQTVIAVPRTCVTPKTKLGRGQATGVIANLYTVRSERNWGCGDLSDLAAIARWAASAGADFVGVNPLHALRARDQDISPYSPVSRLFRSLIYIDPVAVPEFQERMLPGAPLARLRRTGRIEYGDVAALKLGVMRRMHRVFQRTPDTERRRAFARYQQQQGKALRDFATYCTIADELEREDAVMGADWHRWPVELRDPDSSAVEQFRGAHRDEVELYGYIQFELDRQLRQCGQLGRELGLTVGLYQDLAIGSAGGGSDAWAFQSLFAPGVSVGAPPDSYSTQGQDWGFPPINPRALMRDGYRYWRQLLRNAFAHSGALRIDHILGLFRQYWVPHGQPASKGAYVRFPTEDLLGILALESHRAGALVVGEDLGTVPPGVPATLAQWGVLSSRVLYFEQNRSGAFHPPSRYPSHALVTANTHDLAPLAGWREGVDLDLRRRAGAIPSDAEWKRAKAQRLREVAALTRRLVDENLLSSADDVSDGDFIAAVHRFLRRTPAHLVGISLDDLAAEREPVNLPSVGLDRHPNWSRKMTRTIEAIAASVAALVPARGKAD